jgi:perosamine synthetase
MIRLCIPFTDERELSEIAKVLATGFLTQGPKTAEFESRVAAYIGVKHAFAMSSCTTALHLSLVALGVGPGDEVIVPDFTFPATANVVIQLGATPVLADVELDTYTISEASLAAKITPKTRAIMPVHTFGCAADMDMVQRLAASRGIPVVEDAACALGTTYRGKFCGSIGTLGCFSFHPRKVITTGEGGMITTNDDALADKVRLLRSHGGVPGNGRMRFEAAGFNYRLSDVQAAMGVAQMDKLPELLERRRALAEELRSRLADIPGVRVPTNPPWGGHIFQSFVVLLEPPIDRDRVIAQLREAGVETTLGTYSLHAQPFFSRTLGLRPGDLPNGELAYRQSLTLPLYPQLKSEDLSVIATRLQAAIARPA